MNDHARSSDGTLSGQYEQGLAHLQAGEWAQAEACLEPLSREGSTNAVAQRALGEARLRAALFAGGKVPGMRWIVPWSRILLSLLVVVSVTAVVTVTAKTTRTKIAPAIVQVQSARGQARLLAEGDALLAASNLDGAEIKYLALLAQTPGHQGALTGMQRISEHRTLDSLYREGNRLQESGAYVAALGKYTELLVLAPDYRDVSARVATIKQQQELDELYELANADYQAGQHDQALAKYLQITARSAGFHADEIAARLFDIHLQLGRQIVEQDSPNLELMLVAADHFSQALSLRPRDLEAFAEQQQAKGFIEGQTRYQQGLWHEAVAKLRPVFDRRPTYLGSTVVNMLYDAYVRSGDAHRAEDDLTMAYEQYRQASLLPISDRTLARGRLDSIAPLLTPTPTPMPTSTPTATPSPTPPPQPTLAPTVGPLAAYRGRIAYYQKDDYEEGIYLVDPSSGKVQYMGYARAVREQYEALKAQMRYSPDGRHRLYVADGQRSPQVFMELPADANSDTVTNKQLTKLTGVSYDPVWSPDGSRVAFVSQENGSDDIWIIYPDGSQPINLTRNTWEWEKHPSWSPDGRQIAFWSNRAGPRQIFVMDANGSNVRQVTQSEQDAYDPVWIH